MTDNPAAKKCMLFTAFFTLRMSAAEMHSGLWPKFNE
jgi:hypothetical protein